MTAIPQFYLYHGLHTVLTIPSAAPSQKCHIRVACSRSCVQGSSCCMVKINCLYTCNKEFTGRYTRYVLPRYKNTSLVSGLWQACTGTHEAYKTVLGQHLLGGEFFRIEPLRLRVWRPLCDKKCKSVPHQAIKAFRTDAKLRVKG